MDSGLLTFVSDYGGLIIGLILLLLAVSILPGRTKWYVLTAGLAIIGYEAYMRTVNRKLLNEADQERARLRQELSSLDAQRRVLEETVSQLNQKLIVLNTKLANLDQQRGQLEAEGGDLAARRESLDQQTTQLISESREILQEMGNSEAILAKLREATHAVDQLEKIAR